MPRTRTGATLIIEKILGAAADEGRGLEDLVALGTDVTRRAQPRRRLGSHNTPASGTPAFALPDNILEFGVGIHGERAEGTTPHAPLGKLVETMTDQLLAALPDTAGTPALALVNGLGSITSLELYGIRHAVAKALDDRGVGLDPSLTRTSASALDMRGFSLTLFATDAQALRLAGRPRPHPRLAAVTPPL
ncbi:Dihydroxyacetone kinase subunit DhaK OS=Streptomyces antimycoticus OX=68175 GN=SSPO_093600 PE=4 SV=1 [Streptomyces antimycoticus]